MRVEYVNPFVESAMQILKATVDENIERGELFLSNTGSQTKGVVVIIGLAGQVSGRVVLDMTESTALKIASAMNGEELTSIDELVTATLTELGNMITGTAVTKLHELGFQFDLTPPALFKGKDLSISEINIESLVVPLKLPVGEININVAIKEN
ncbi:MAG: chemotaxis protein CheX [Spirochaetes bacterium]|nr:chemotaxis protein CheX [Spirochaetota bacterium]